MSKSTIRRRLHRSTYSEIFTKPYSSGTASLGQMREMNLYHIDGTKKNEKGEELLMIQNTPFTLWDGHIRMAASGIVVLVFVDDEILTKAAT